VEQECRDYKTFGVINCMRDHYYQLFDLEKNFGEKRFCDRESEFNNDAYKPMREHGMNQALGDALGIGRGTPSGKDSNKVGGNKPTDPFGYSLGVETSPAALWINDCCVLNIDEKPDEGLVSRKRRPRTFDPCSTIRVRKNGVEGVGKKKGGGKCVERKPWVKKFGKFCHKTHIYQNTYISTI